MLWFVVLAVPIPGRRLGATAVYCISQHMKVRLAPFKAWWSCLTVIQLYYAIIWHKRLSAALNPLNEKVTECRQWKMQHEAMIWGECSPEDYNMGSKKKKNKKNQHEKAATGNDTMIFAGGFNSRKRGPDLGGHEGASGLFIGPCQGYLLKGLEIKVATWEVGVEKMVNMGFKKKRRRIGQGKKHVKRRRW